LGGERDVSDEEIGHIDPSRRYWIRRSWTRLWWRAINPDESLAIMDSHTNHRAWTREGLLSKLRRMNEPQDDPWEEVNVRRDLFAESERPT
jgi:hypothetical protein